VVAVLLAAAVAFGATIGARSLVHARTARSAPATSGAMPRSAPIEQQWGIRFTVVRLIAATGVVDVRYQVVDEAKSGRLRAHSDRSSLPTLRASGGTIKPEAVMFHFHSTSDAFGRTFDIIYGNAGGAVHVGDRITVVTADGLQLRGVPVTE
jgi:hypothetical protein